MKSVVVVEVTSEVVVEVLARPVKAEASLRAVLVADGSCWSRSTQFVS